MRPSRPPAAPTRGEKAARASRDRLERMHDFPWGGLGPSRRGPWGGGRGGGDGVPGPRRRPRGEAPTIRGPSSTAHPLALEARHGPQGRGASRLEAGAGAPGPRRPCSPPWGGRRSVLPAALAEALHRHRAAPVRGPEGLEGGRARRRGNWEAGPGGRQGALRGPSPRVSLVKWPSLRSTEPSFQVRILGETG